MNLSPFLTGNTCVLGLQWGDEGKGKIVDLLTEKADVVVRYCGGANAGHSVKIGGEKYATHLLPVGVLRSNILNIIGNGVVLDPEVLFREIDDFTARGLAITPANLKISFKTHVVMPWHKAEDAARESASEGSAIGTTRRGIGPAYADKMQRTTAIRVADLLREESLKQKIGRISPSATPSSNASTTPRRWNGSRSSKPTATSAGACSPSSRTPARSSSISTARERRSSSKAPTPSCSTSTTAPTPTSPAAPARRLASFPAPASRRKWCSSSSAS